MAHVNVTQFGSRQSRSVARYLAACGVLTAVLSPQLSQAARMEWATVGDPGNAPDSSGFGAVDYEFQISKFEVTNAQYVEFLNHVAATDPFDLYDSEMANFGIQRVSAAEGYSYSLTDSSEIDWAKKPVNLVSWYDAIRFVNWMNNGKGDADTESGAYTLVGATPIPESPATIVRNADAKVWLPSIDEWYKAAYYDPNKPGGAGYWRYPTASDATPSNEIVIPDAGNNANFTGSNLQPTLDGAIKLTDVGQFADSASAYGTFDAAGNVAEWSETLVPGLGMLRAQLGGSWGSLAVGLQGANARFAFNGPAVNSERGGFRVARIPEPACYAIAITAIGMLSLSRRFRFRSRRNPSRM